MCVTVCCSVLQCVLQCVEVVWYRAVIWQCVEMRVAVRYNVCCSVLQRAAVCVAVRCSHLISCRIWQCVEMRVAVRYNVCCSVLQRAAVCVAVRCSHLISCIYTQLPSRRLLRNLLSTKKKLNRKLTFEKLSFRKQENHYRTASWEIIFSKNKKNELTLENCHIFSNSAGPPAISSIKPQREGRGGEERQR